MQHHFHQHTVYPTHHKPKAGPTWKSGQWSSILSSSFPFWILQPELFGLRSDRHILLHQVRDGGEGGRSARGGGQRLAFAHGSKLQEACLFSNLHLQERIFLRPCVLLHQLHCGFSLACITIIINGDADKTITIDIPPNPLFQITPKIRLKMLWLAKGDNHSPTNLVDIAHWCLWDNKYCLCCLFVANGTTDYVMFWLVYFLLQQLHHWFFIFLDNFPLHFMHVYDVLFF